MQTDHNQTNREEANKETKPSELEEWAAFQTLKSWFEDCVAHSREWRTNAMDEYDFAAGDQWKDQDREALEQAGRPAITFNRINPILRAVSGLEINSRRELQFIPRGTSPGEIRANETLSAASQYMDDQTDSGDEQSEAFEDSLMIGMGWVEARVDFTRDPEGEYVETRVDPLTMYWDQRARSKNLQDARRVFRVVQMTLGEAREMFPGKMDEDLDAGFAALNMSREPQSYEVRRLKLDDGGPHDPKSIVHLIHAQWYENEDYFRVADPYTGELISVEKDEWEHYKQQVEASGRSLPEKVKMQRRVVKQCFMGGEILDGVKDGLSRDLFSFQCITGIPHRGRKSGTWYGLVKAMKEPQAFANKWLSQTLHILNSTAKGGVIAEKNAFADPRQAERSYASPTAITWASKDAIAQKRIMPKPGAGLTNGYAQLLQFAIDSIPAVTGINQELLGLRDVNQPGVLEAHRKQSAMTILAPIMDSKRRFLKNLGRIKLSVIQEYFSDGRLVRITTPEGVQELRKLTPDVTQGDHEIIVSEAPTSPNQKEATWAAITQVLPAFKEMLTPEVAMLILDYSPLPQPLVQAMRELQSKPNEGAQMQQQMVMAEEQRKQAESEATVAKDQASAEKLKVDAAVALLEAELADSKHELDAAKSIADDNLKRAQFALADEAQYGPAPGTEPNLLQEDGPPIPSPMQEENFMNPAEEMPGDLDDFNQ